MDVELNNDKNNQKQNDIYTMINDFKINMKYQKRGK